MLEGKITFYSTFGVGTEFKFAIKISNNNNKTTKVNKMQDKNPDLM